MTENRKIQNTQCNNWTEQHDAYCLENKITPAAKLLWQWLIRQGIGDETEPDLNEFNDWVQQHRGKGYSRPTLKAALAQLVECRVVQIIKKFTWSIVRIITRPLDWLKPRKNLPNRSKTFNLHTPNNLTAEQELDSSSIDPLTEERVAELEEILSECEQAGIVFDPEQSPEILDYTIEEVRSAIALFHSRGGHVKVKNPQGWLLACLRKRWYDQPQQWSFAGLLAALGVKL
ncbi:hypothetical protein [Nostoc sp. TCL26-01]|uniref:hypothetical protein n=1 Tax=Nostoc sp. TCL26-01 TaxID=2576904 RepID=UPI0015BBF601|nr:hypothetical protein [Nostoc sp. TCL26-01]QLE55657.1 hypothetical protein FD725_09090 [Nostoc sp. TCL26-01]